MQSLQTSSAKQIAVRLLQTQAMRRPDVPKECEGKSLSAKPSKSEMDTLVQACIDAVQKLSTAVPTVQQHIADAKSALANEIQSITQKIAADESQINQINDLLDTNSDLTQTIIKWPIPSLGIILVLILIAPRLYGSALQAEIFNQRLTLDLLTVYILVSTILNLGLASRIQNEVLGTLLGGISGYVPGRSGALRQQQNGADNRVAAA